LYYSGAPDRAILSTVAVQWIKMTTLILPKSELTALILAEVRQHKGCDGVDAVVIQENLRARSGANWEISIIAASSGDPTTVQQAAAAVQRNLQFRYQLSGTKAYRFQVGDRVRLSELGRSRFPARQTALGTVIVEKSRTGGSNVRVLFDGSKKSVRLHEAFVEPTGPDQTATATSKDIST
jgi:hypothetical protein